LASGTLEEVHDVEFDKTKGSQDENENLDDARGFNFQMPRRTWMLVT
jgi:hypothetical protein